MTNKSELQNRVTVTNTFGTKARFVDSETYIKTADLAEYLRVAATQTQNTVHKADSDSQSVHNDALEALEEIAYMAYRDASEPNAVISKWVKTIRAALTAPRYEELDVEEIKNSINNQHIEVTVSQVRGVVNHIFDLIETQGLKIMREVK